jgi:hypothetical protein
MTLTATALGVIGLFGLVVVFAIARRAIRWMVKLALLGLLLVAVLIGAVVIWWEGRSSSSEQPRESRPAASRRSNTH